MRDFRDAKAMARRLREALAERDVRLAHSDCLELIARSFGVKDWHVLAAEIAAADSPAAAEAAPPDSASPGPAAGAWSGPVLMLRDIVVFPKLSVPLFVGRDVSVRAQQSAYEGELELLLVTQRDRDDDSPTREALYDVGVIADVLQRYVLPDNTVKLLVRARQRARLVRLSTEDGVSRAEAALLPGAATAPPGAADEVAAGVAAFAAYAATRGDKIPDEVRARAAGITQAGVLADVIAAHAVAPLAAKQAVLETLEPRRRLAAALALITPVAAAA